MRAILPLFFGVALGGAACGGSEPSVVSSPPPPAPKAAASAVTTAAVAPGTSSTFAPQALSSAASAKEDTAQAASASAKEGTASTTEPSKPKDPCKAGMVLVPGGIYTMGRPRREVTIAALCMDVNEVTAEEYAACVKAKKCSDQNLKCAAQATYEAPGKEKHPINCVDFEQAITYCKAQNKRLASDEEWEWAARGGPLGQAYPWGNDKPNGKACWSGESVLVGTCAAGATPAGDSPQGIHDLAGNVFEWTTSRNDKAGPDRIGRGGSWRDGAPDGLKASRSGPGFKATYRCGFLGIRCVVEPVSP